jgi:hypothetical protein
LETSRLRFEEEETKKHKKKLEKFMKVEAGQEEPMGDQCFRPLSKHPRAVSHSNSTSGLGSILSELELMPKLKNEGLFSSAT